MASGFANEQIQPHVRNGKERLEQINNLLKEQSSDEDREILQERIKILENWQKRANQILPLVLKLIQN
jgi:hypothetical protein